MLVVAAATTFALRPAVAEHWSMWVALLGSYTGLAVWSGLALHKRKLLGQRLRPRGGDLSVGILLGLLLATFGVVAQRALAPAGAPSHAWLFTIYAQVGNIQADPALLTGLAVLVIAEELVWRGFVLETIRERLGTRWAAPLSAVAYAIAHLPTAWTLSTPAAGLNPLLVLASLGCGLVWAFATLALGRLWPVIASHLVFTYFMAAPLPSWLP
jgi:membrane protease YdiL (CAAX protease family)